MNFPNVLPIPRCWFWKKDTNWCSFFGSGDNSFPETGNAAAPSAWGRHCPGPWQRLVAPAAVTCSLFVPPRKVYDSWETRWVELLYRDRQDDAELEGNVCVWMGSETITAPPGKPEWEGLLFLKVVSRITQCRTGSVSLQVSSASPQDHVAGPWCWLIT